MKIKRQNKLGTYLAVTAGAGCATSVAQASVVFYGVDSANDTNVNPNGINITFSGKMSGVVSMSGDTSDAIFNVSSTSVAFTNGSDLDIFRAYNSPTHRTYSNLQNGAAEGDLNYANIDFNNDGVYEAVGQFNFGAINGDGFLVALAFVEGTTLADGTTLLTSENSPIDLSTLTNTSGLTISAGKALIDAAAVPEPSSIALLALGSAGLLARRKRQVAA